MIKLNLGASDDRKEGFVSVDIAPPADVIADLRHEWPWETSSVDEIYAKDIAEHLGSGYRLKKRFRAVAGTAWNTAESVLEDVELEPYNGMIFFMNQCHRILKPGGQLELIVPCYPGITPWCDPTHASVWTSDTRYYFDERWNHPGGERGRLGPSYGITALFRTAGGRSGVGWTPISYAQDAPERRKLFLVLEAVK
jgi:hypothetical protein